MANGSSVGGGGGDGSTAAAPPEGAYNPADYAHLSVAAEVRDLFQYIVRYKPHDVELETTLKCFVPDYIPTLGEMDAFLKVPRPDGKADDLGFKVLDEPSAQQSDAAVLELQLRAVTKRRHGDAAVRSIEGAHKAPQEVERWVTSIAELHRTKPPPQVHYKRSMPDVDKLMEVWPEEFEQLLSTAQLPGPELEMSLEEYAKTICAIMDIPVYENIIESLHLLFTVYQEFKNNAHFAGAAASGAAPSDAFLSSSYK
ncbi:intraflagellar transport complex B protein 46 [Tribonema minus]|uniref:Intraflagellar transport complex B protein 46 n=1 Tax=Tribonema minus TaxID=303371 RepID=A0A835YT86_9STRA|nr:intraflagellar transport complex B protein 46 [Tribonema minus]